MSTVTFSDLATAAYCPRNRFYRRRDDELERPPEAAAVPEIAFDYGRVLTASDAELAAEPIAVDPGTWRTNLRRVRASREAWPSLRDPADRERLLFGRDCRGVVHKALADPPGVSLVSTGEPPPRAAWKPRRVSAVAAAKALAWERQSPVRQAFVAYPSHGVIHRVSLDGRRRAEYRRTLRTVRTLSGVPPRHRNTSKCAACEYREPCGVETRTSRSLLG